MGEKV